jgi:serine O-acetyltransferase
MSGDTTTALHQRIRALLVGVASSDAIDVESVVDAVLVDAWDDLQAVALRDAAARGDVDYVLSCYSTYEAVLTYRVAHQLVQRGSALQATRPEADRRLGIAARSLAEHAKVATGVEIHPAATVGRRLVIDHGFGTVIGEETILGDDCYLLQGVILGGRSIGNSALIRGSRRHPRIGDRVQFGGGACVFGPVTVGDDCYLGPGVRVTADLAAGARVQLRTFQQVCTSPLEHTGASRSFVAG